MCKFGWSAESFGFLTPTGAASPSMNFILRRLRRDTALESRGYLPAQAASLPFGPLVPFTLPYYQVLRFRGPDGTQPRG